MIKNIVFDVGNVLVTFRWRDHMRDLGFSREEIDILGRNWVKAPIWSELDRGVLTEEQAISLAIDKTPELEGRIRQFYSNPVGLVVKREQTIPWVEGYKKRGFGLYILSNYPESFWKAHTADFDFLPLMDGETVSYREKVIKPDPEIYRRLLRRYSLTAGECVFTDDKADNVEAARSVGLHAVLFQNFAQASEDIDRIIAEQAREE